MEFSSKFPVNRYFFRFLYSTIYEYHKEKLFPIIHFCRDIKHILTSELKMALRGVTASDFLMFQTEVIRDKKPCGVVLHFQTARQGCFSIKYYDFFCPTFEEKTKLHTSKDFSKKHSKSAKIQFFQTLRYNTPPPTDTQTTKRKNLMLRLHIRDQTCFIPLSSLTQKNFIFLVKNRSADDAK